VLTGAQHDEALRGAQFRVVVGELGQSYLELPSCRWGVEFQLS
jgi:hypothetical protein